MATTAPDQEAYDIDEEPVSPESATVATESNDNSAPEEHAAAGKPVGYDKAVLLAQRNGCQSYIRVDYETASGATYSTACSNGEHTLIMCNASSCRMVD